MKSSQTNHDTHEVEIILVTTAHHYAKLHCVECNKWIKWLTRAETNAALELNLVSVQPRKTRNDFFNEI